MGTKYKQKRRSKKAGLPPGALVHVGEKKTSSVKVSLVAYDESGIEEKELSGMEECLPYRKAKAVTWVNVTGLHEVGVVEKTGELFGIHPLVLEDILNTEQRPKMEDYDDYLFIVMKMLHRGNAGDGPAEATAGGMAFEQVSMLLLDGLIITFQEVEKDVFEPVRGRLRAGKGRIRKRGADYLAYALTDALVDSYFGVLEDAGEAMEGLEERLLKDPSTETLSEINALKRQMVALRRAIWPTREIMSRLERGGSGLVDQSTLIYLRDVYDHTIQVADSIESNRDMLSGMLDIYLSSVSNRMNEVMKLLTIIATIFIPITFIAGVYGMNFEHMPELRWPWGYFASLGVMAAVAATMLIYFQRKGWL